MEYVSAVAQALDDYSSAIQAVASVVALIVAAVAVWIAKAAQRAEAGQEVAARAALDLAQRQNADAVLNERARRTEVQVLAAGPLRVVEIGHAMSGRGIRTLIVHVKNETATTAFGVTVSSRGISNPEPLPGENVGWGTLGPGQDHPFILSVEPFLEPTVGTGRTTYICDEVEIDVLSKGLLGQTVRQTYAYRLDRMNDGSSDKWWWEKRREIIPSLDEGQTRVTFDG